MNCTGCKSKDTSAVARCFDCANYLCPNCVTAHKFMHCFEGHRVKSLEEIETAASEDGELPYTSGIVPSFQNNPMYLSRTNNYG